MKAQNISRNTKSPEKVAFMSAIIPGLGQTYNKKYWKIPIIYAGLITSVYYIDDNNKKYLQYKNAYIMRIDNDPNTDDNFKEYTNNDLIILKDFYRRNREISILSFVLIYILNIVDASVDTYFFDYDISDDLSLHLIPISNPSKSYTGLSLSLNL